MMREPTSRRSRLAPGLVLASLLVIGVLLFALREAPPDTGGALGPGRGAESGAGVVDAPAGDLVLPRVQSSASGAEGAAQKAPLQGERRVATPGVPDDSIWVEGRVIFPPGTPLDERAVVVARSSRRFEGKKGMEARLSRAPVDEQGRFRAAFSAGSRSGKLMVEGRYLYQIGRHEVSLREPPAQLELEPKLGGRIRFQLVPPDALGFGAGELEGARVNAFSYSGEDGDDVGDRWASAAADGSFTIDALPPRTNWVALFTLPAFVDEWHDSIEVRAGELTTVEVTARRGVRLSGQVVDDEARGLAQARVIATSDAEESNGADASTLTDESGRFTLRGLEPGEVDLEAALPGRLEHHESLGARVEGDVIEGLEITLSSGLAIAGSVLWPDGTPAEGARVRVVEAGEGSSWFMFDFEGTSAEVDAHGGFCITGLGPVAYSVLASAREGDPDAKLRARAAAATARVRRDGVEAGTLDLVLELQTGVVARGRVVDDTGRPVERFQVTAEPSDDEGAAVMLSGPVAQKFEAEDGHFELQGLEPGTCVLTASARGHLPSMGRLFPIADGGELVLVVHRPASLSGTVLDASGQPVRGADIEASNEEFGEYGDYASATTNRSGAFRLRRVAPGPVTLVADAVGHGQAEPLELELAPGEVRKEVVLYLRQAARLTGEVHAFQGRVEGREVIVEGEDVAYWETITTDAAGRFELQGLSPGSYTVGLTAVDEEPGRDDGLSGAFGFYISGGDDLVASVEVELEEGESEHVVLGSPPADPIRVHGRVTEAGAPVAGLKLSCRPGGEEEWEERVAARATTDETGNYQLIVDGAGEYTLRVGENWNETLVLPFELSSGSDRRVDVELPTGRIAGVVTGPAGPLAEIEVQVTMMQAAEGRTSGVGREATTDAEGRFEAARLPAGSYRVEAGVEAWEWNDGGDPRSLARVVLHDVELAEGAERADLRLTLSPGGALEGVVLDANGAPAAGVDLWFEDERGADLFPSAWHESDGAGRFRAAPLRAGRVRVRPMAEDVLGEGVTVVVPEGGVARAEVRLEP